MKLPQVVNFLQEELNENLLAELESAKEYAAQSPEHAATIHSRLEELAVRISEFNKAIVLLS